MKMLKIALVAIVLLVAGLLLLIRLLNFFPAEVMPAQVACEGAKPVALKPGDRVRLLVWNIQYGASRKYNFFYDGGKDVYAEKAVVEETLKGMRKLVGEIKPDIILWQEIDRNSKRTAYIDQLKALWDKERFACYTFTPYHLSSYVPSPAHQHLGRVDFNLANFSRYAMEKGKRYALPQLKESFIRQAFNLKRAVLKVEIPIEGQKAPLVLFNTHLSAFSYGDGTMHKQAKYLYDLTQEAEKAGALWLLAGDMNLLPPGDDPKRLGEKEAAYYSPDAENPIRLLFDKLQNAVSLADYKKEPTRFNTYIPFNAKKADRWIDHTFLSKRIKLERYEVIQNFLSDHLPIVIEITLPK